MRLIVSKARKLGVLTGLISSCCLLNACNGGGSGDPGTALGTDAPIQLPIPVETTGDNATPPDNTAPPVTTTPPTDQNNPGGGAPSNVVGRSCHSDDPNHLCLALKYVVYKSANAVPVVPEQDAIANMSTINAVWSQCNIGFQIDQFVEADAASYGLSFNTANLSDLDSIRRAFEDSSTLLVATTGPWNRSGTLGSTAANAWTNMPGEGVYGVVLESPVGTFAQIIAHELGHYLNLDHVSDSLNNMNPVIYGNSTKLTQGQCSAARDAVNYYWRGMLR